MRTRKQNNEPANSWDYNSEVVKSIGLGRVPPSDIDTEKAILGCILIEKDAIFRINDLKPEEFYRDAHVSIYRAITDVLAAGKPIDLFTVMHRLREMDKIEYAGGVGYLAELSSTISSTANLEIYVLRVKEHAIRRRLIAHGFNIQQNAYNEAVDALALLSEVNTDLSRINDNSSSDRTQNHSDVMAQVLRDYDAAMRGGTGITGVTTGSHKLDKATGGFQKDDFVLVAGRPGMFKTGVLAFFIMSALKSGIPVDLYNLEMTNTSYGRRFMSSEAVIPYSDIRRGIGGPDEMRRVHEAQGRIGDWPLTYTNEGGIDLERLCMLIRKHHRTKKTGMVVIDYIQLITVQGITDDNIRVARISKALRALGLQLQIPIVAAAQLSRNTESRQTRKPSLSDLRDSGQLEQDATLVMALFRPDYYTIENEKSAGRGIDDVVMTHELEILILKQREGSVGSRVHWCDVATNRIFADNPGITKIGSRYYFGNDARPEGIQGNLYSANTGERINAPSLESFSTGDAPF